MYSASPAAPIARVPSPPRPHGAAVADLQSALDPLRAAGRHDDAYELLLSAYAAVFAKNTELALLVAKLRHPGRRSERVDPQDLQLLFEQFLGTADPAALVNQLEAEVSSEQDAVVEREIALAIAAAEAAADRAPTPPRRRATKAWQTTAAVAHAVHTHEVALEERRCATCGDE